MEQLPSVRVTPRDSVDINQLQSLLSSHKFITPLPREHWKVGVQGIVYINIQSYIAQPITIWDDVEVSVNELARQLSMT